MFSRHVLIVLIMLVLLAYVRSIFFHLTQMQFTLQPPPRPLPPPTTAPDLSILQSHHRNPTRAPSLPHTHHSFRPGALDSGAATPHVGTIRLLITERSHACESADVRRWLGALLASLSVSWGLEAGRIRPDGSVRHQDEGRTVATARGWRGLGCMASGRYRKDRNKVAPGPHSSYPGRNLNQRNSER